MKILIYGSKGWIGKMLQSSWKISYPDDKIFESNERLDYFHIESIEKEIRDILPDRVICLIGRTSGWIEDKYISNIDYLENKGKLYENIRDNLYGPLLLTIICNKLGIHLTYIGTGCIFSRNTNENDYIYTEDDKPDFFGSSYSVVKGFTDQILPLFNNVLNCRIRMPITNDFKDPKSFVSKIISYQKVIDMPNSMTYLPDMLPLIIELSKMKQTGTIHIVNKGHISHSEILDVYKIKVNPSHVYEKISTDELDSLTKGSRSNNIISTQKLEEIFPNKIRDIKECIEEIFKLN